MGGGRRRVLPHPLTLVKCIPTGPILRERKKLPPDNPDITNGKTCRILSRHEAGRGASEVIGKGVGMGGALSYLIRHSGDIRSDKPLSHSLSLSLSLSLFHFH